MSPFTIVVLVVFSLIILVQVWGFIKSKRSVGKDIPFAAIDEKFVDKIKGNAGLIYFHSPKCHNCKTQTPIIEELAKEFKNIISIDASANIETARAFNVLGTPSTVVFGENKINGYFVGVKSKNFLAEKLKSS